MSSTFVALSFVSASYPALSRLKSPEAYQSLSVGERRQALILLGEAYRSTQDEELQEGLCSLMILTASPRLAEHLAQGADLDTLLEALLSATLKGRDIEGALSKATFVERRTRARQARRDSAAAQHLPHSSTQGSTLTIRQAFTKLTPRYQWVLTALALGWRPQQIAKALGIKESAARKLIERVRAALRVTLR